jgi:threonine dehydrogenase-like Zn-dependent dehydrogenase
MLGIERDGGFSQYTTVPLSQIHPIGNELSDELNTFAEPVAAALSVLQAPLEKQDTIWVCGSGRIANLCTFILREHGYTNITQGLTPPTETYHSMVLIQQPPSAGDCPQQWIKNLKPDGLVVLKTRTPDKLFIPVNQLIKKRVRIHAVNYAPLPAALAFITKHADFFATLAGPVFQLEQYQAAFAEAQNNKEQKVFFAVKPSDSTQPVRTS